MSLETHDVQCPYCGETIEIDIEPQDDKQEFIEDCSVCCRPIQVRVTLDGDDGVAVTAERSD